MTNLKTPERVDVLIAVLKEFNTITDDLAKKLNGKSLNTIQKVCNDFMNRTRINNEALIPILKIYKTDASLLLPIGLILRSVLSDFLTSCYLITFHDPNEVDSQSVKNELLILDRDFLRSFLKAMELEKSIHELSPAFNSPFKNEADYEAKILSIKKSFSNLFKKDNVMLKLKEPKDFRETSNAIKFFETPQEYASVGGGFMSEEYKFERIKKRGFGLYASAFIPFKYFSQFQHYSKRGVGLLQKEFEGFGYFHIVHSINILLIATQFQIQIVDGKESDYTIQVSKLVPKLGDALG